MIKTALLIASPLAVLYGSSAFGRETEVWQRTVVLLDFAAIPAGNTEPGPDSARSVARAMMDDFTFYSVVPVNRWRSVPQDPAVAPQSFTRLVRTPQMWVPTWMRAGGRGAEAEATTGSLAENGNCGDRDYSTSGLLKAAGEERRKILYPLIVRSACRHGLPVGLFDAMIMQESRYNVAITSPKGAFGLGQLMPATAVELGVDRFNIYENLDGSARYLAAHLREFQRPALALAAYNAGPRRVRTLRRVPRISETEDYVRQIMQNWQVLERRAANAR